MQQIQPHGFISATRPRSESTVTNVSSAAAPKWCHFHMERFWERPDLKRQVNGGRFFIRNTCGELQREFVKWDHCWCSVQRFCILQSAAHQQCYMATEWHYGLIHTSLTINVQMLGMRWVTSHSRDSAAETVDVQGFDFPQNTGWGEAVNLSRYDFLPLHTSW